MTATLTTLMMACAPLVHPTTLRAMIAVESAGNPYAVSVNRPQALQGLGLDPPYFAQPRSAQEALRLTRRLLAQGYGASVGLAQINVERLAAWRLPIADLFNPCTNLAVAQRVLLECQSALSRRGLATAAARLQRTLLCYNAGAAASEVPNRYAATVRRAAMRQPDSASRRGRGPA